MKDTTTKDTYITLAARHSMYVVIAVGSLLLCAGVAAQAAYLDKRMASDARV